ncbi:conserved hypothethical protein (plasmid) [Ralstonia solanacearum CMR15]|nr:conserved hypothethical protein [Ralstonia solanacearum CMR15]
MAIKHESAPEATARGRITARLSADKQALLQLAADLSGSTLNQFVLQSALRAAEQVIEHEETIKAIKLTVEQSRRFVALPDEPAKPNEALRRAMERFRKTKLGTANLTFNLERRPQRV